MNTSVTTGIKSTPADLEGMMRTQYVLGNMKGLLSDQEIDYFCKPSEDLEALIKLNILKAPMIENYIDHSVRPKEGEKKFISYGLGPSSYDVRIGNKLKIFTNMRTLCIDPLNFDDDCYDVVESDTFFIIPAGSYALAVTKEKFNIPDFITPICFGKSTYARSGIIINPTEFSPGWSGEAVIEISNATPSPVMIYANQGIATINFFHNNRCSKNYDVLGGKYQNQTGIQNPI